jgi:hypothetical protein
LILELEKFSLKAVLNNAKSDSEKVKGIAIAK